MFTGHVYWSHNRGKYVSKWSSKRGNEEGYKEEEEEEEEVGIPKDNMFSLELIRWTYTFSPT